MDRIIGKVCYANAQRGFFFVEVKAADCTLLKYFLHYTRIRRCFPEVIEKGCRVSFVPGPVNSARPTDFPNALEADVYWSSAQLEPAQPQTPKAGL
jgi:hypothetical protein